MQLIQPLDDDDCIRLIHSAIIVDVFGLLRILPRELIVTGLGKARSIGTKIPGKGKEIWLGSYTISIEIACGPSRSGTHLPELDQPLNGVTQADRSIQADIAERSVELELILDEALEVGETQGSIFIQIENGVGIPVSDRLGKNIDIRRSEVAIPVKITIVDLTN